MHAARSGLRARRSQSPIGTPGVEDTHPDHAGRTWILSTFGEVFGQRHWRRRISTAGALVYHGTSPALSRRTTDIGIDGVAPRQPSWRFRPERQSPHLPEVRDVRVYVGATSHGVDIVNNSYSMDPWVCRSTDPEGGGPRATRSIKYAQGKGLAVIAAAGNERGDIDNPARIDNGSPTVAPARP